MNIDDLKSSWKKEGEFADISSDISRISEAVNNPLKKIRVNMKKELLSFLLSFILMGFMPKLSHFSVEFSIAFYSIFILYMLIAIYYFVRFYIIFKQLHKYNDSSKDSLYEVYINIKMYMEMYRSFSFLLIPLILVSSVLIGFNSKLHDGVLTLEKLSSQWFSVLIMMLVCIPLVLFLVNWWINYFYGRYAKQIRKLLDELKEIPE